MLSMHGSAVATSISIPRSAAAAEGRDLRSTAAEASDRSKAATRSTPEASSPAQPPFGHAGEVHSTLELELRTSNELEVRPEPVEIVQSKVPEAGALEGVRPPLRTCVITIRLRDLRRCLCSLHDLSLLFSRSGRSIVASQPHTHTTTIPSHPLNERTHAMRP